MTSSQTVESWRALYPFAAHWHAVPEGRLHYVDEGRGEAVVMLHGNPTWSFMYRDLVRRLAAKGMRAVAIDNMGCGLSDKPQDYAYRLQNHIDNAESLIEGLGVERLDLVVHDWGGAIGFGYAVRHPEKIRRLVVVNSAAFLIDRCPWRIRSCRLPLFGTLAVRVFNGFARAALHSATAHPERLSAEVKAGYLAPYDSFAHRIATLRFVQDIPLSPKHPTWKTVAEMQKGLCKLTDKPMLIAWGMRDFCFTSAFLNKWLEYFPKAEVKRYEDDGHYLFEDAGDSLGDEIERFLG